MTSTGTALPKTPDSGFELENGEEPVKDKYMVTKYMHENEELRYLSQVLFDSWRTQSKKTV